jgi:hypothetical protein
MISAAVMTTGQTASRVRFRAGTIGTTLKGTVRGYAYRDYIVGASAGQTITLSLTSAPSDSVFTVFLPNGDNLEGAAEMNDFSGELPANGDYVVRVGMMRSAARRKGSTANYVLKVKIN